MHYLRANNVRSHFTAGGHFPSLRPKETLELLPELDTIVRFEGELTLAELLARLNQPAQWEHIQSIAFRKGVDIILTPLRPLIADLDSLPVIFRTKPREIAFGLKTATMLASRGCLFNCSFCSIRQFYGTSKGGLRRVRSPQAVLEEMLSLFREKEVRFFCFQDDDFAARTPRQRVWLGEFLHALDKAQLSDHIRWKISCRVDDLEPEILEKMMNHGLMAVYLGVESGSETGLRTLNKHVSVEQNLSAIKLLEQHDIAVAIGFMLFDPSSTIDTVRENIAFLRTVGESGYFPINFCKMLPYAGTPIEKHLRETSRLKGTSAHPDYDFLDPQLNWYAFLVQRIFTRRNFHHDGLVARLQQADFDYHLAKSFRIEENVNEHEETLYRLISRSNMLAIETLTVLLDEAISRGGESLINEQNVLLEIADTEWHGEALIETEMEALSAALSI
jgi:radical SAM superfamily enzyme YgiQ (UPF0313 family)